MSGPDREENLRARFGSRANAGVLRAAAALQPAQEIATAILPQECCDLRIRRAGLPDRLRIAANDTRVPTT